MYFVFLPQDFAVPQMMIFDLLRMWFSVCVLIFIGRQWTYQTCVEFGFFQSSSYQPQIFGNKFPVDFYIQECEDIFGSKYNTDFLNTAVDRTNTMYGALNIEATNIVFVHGSIDPWHALGITKTLNQGAPAIYINGTYHI